MAIDALKGNNSLMSQNDKKTKFKLIFNPRAGEKRGFLFRQNSKFFLEQLRFLLEKYQIPVDFYPTKKAGHATELAKDAIKEKYKGVLVVGGDGTVGEVANGLIGSEMVLGILPLGSFMNIARMLSIPNDLDQAIMLIKIGRVRKIDAGKVTMLNGIELNPPYFFLESSSMGLEAQAHEYIHQIESGKGWSLIKMVKSFWDFYIYSSDIQIDDLIIHTKASAIVVGNGSLSGPGLAMSLEAKLNDHLLTVSIYKMAKFELIRLAMNLLMGKKQLSRKIDVFQGRKITISNRFPRLVHADARLFGKTPFKCQVEPNALSIITGFPEAGVEYLKKRTPLDP